MKERLRLGIGVRKVCQTLIDKDGAYEYNLATMEASTRKVVGGNVSEPGEVVDVD